MTDRVWPCRKCGFFNSDGDKKCPNCGSPKQPWPKGKVVGLVVTVRH